MRKSFRNLCARLLCASILITCLTILPRHTAYASPIPVYEVLNPDTNETLFTKDANEVQILNAKHSWIYRGIAFYASSSGVSTYRLYNPDTGEHHYTSDSNEKRVLTGLGWQNEGVAFITTTDTSYPVYRIYNRYAPSVSAHWQTINKSNYDAFLALGYNGEGIAWYSAAPVSDNDYFYKLTLVNTTKGPQIQTSTAHMSFNNGKITAATSPVKTNTSKQRSYNEQAICDAIERYTNQARVANGLKPVVISNVGNQAAKLRANECLSMDSLNNHIRPDGSNGIYTLDRSFNLKKKNLWFGENLAQAWLGANDDATGRIMVDLWLNSPGHRANMLNPNRTALGVGVSVASNGKTFAVQAMLIENPDAYR